MNEGTREKRKGRRKRGKEEKKGIRKRKVETIIVLAEFCDNI